MAEADKEYLKFIFDKYAKMKAGAANVGGSSSFGGITSAPSPAVTVAFAGGADMSVPDMAAASFGGFDISV